MPFPDSVTAMGERLRGYLVPNSLSTKSGTNSSDAVWQYFARVGELSSLDTIR